MTLFSHVFKKTDGGSLFSAQLDPMLVLLASVVASSVGLAIPARGADGPGAGDSGLSGCPRNLFALS